MFFDCPDCGQTLKAADDAGGKKCRCTKCQSLVTIPGGSKKPSAPAPTGSSTSGSRTNQPTNPAPRPVGQVPLPKPTVASELDDMIVRQQEQFLQQSAERHVHMESARRRAESHQQNAKYYEPSRSSASPIKTILAILSVVGMFLLLGCCGLLGYFVYGNKQDLITDTYAATANGLGVKRSSSFGAAKGEGLISRQTGSEFWLYEARFPEPGSAEAMRQRIDSASGSKESVQRGNLNGTHYSRVNGSALNLPGDVICELEVFVEREKFTLTCYLPGSAKHAAGVQPQSRWESMEKSIDRPESFFSSLRNKNAQ